MVVAQVAEGLGGFPASDSCLLRVHWLQRYGSRWGETGTGRGTSLEAKTPWSPARGAGAGAAHCSPLSAHCSVLTA